MQQEPSPPQRSRAVPGRVQAALPWRGAVVLQTRRWLSRSRSQSSSVAAPMLVQVYVDRSPRAPSWMGRVSPPVRLPVSRLGRDARHFGADRRPRSARRFLRSRLPSRRSPHRRQAQGGKEQRAVGSGRFPCVLHSGRGDVRSTGRSVDRRPTGSHAIPTRLVQGPRAAPKGRPPLLGVFPTGDRATILLARSQWSERRREGK